MGWKIAKLVFYLKFENLFMVEGIFHIELFVSAKVKDDALRYRDFSSFVCFALDPISRLTRQVVFRKLHQANLFDEIWRNFPLKNYAGVYRNAAIFVF